MSHTDFIQRFYFSGLPFRGAIIKLTNSFLEALNAHNYPAEVNALLGESLAAAGLMGIHLKHNAKISLQARGDGATSMLMAEATIQQATESLSKNASKHTIRGVARLREQPASSQSTIGNTFQDLLGHGQLAITIEPENGERYQGLVTADQPSLKLCLQAYFDQSEQLPTLFQLATSSTSAAGLLLQRMPHEENDALTTASPNTQLAWDELTTLAGTLSNQELLELPTKTVLFRLFNEHAVKLSPPDSIHFQCSCSYQRTSAALQQINPLEIEAILQEDQEIVMDCEFCSSRYRFTRQEIEQLSIKSSQTNH